MLRRIVTIISIGLVVGVNAEQDKLDKIQKTLDNIMAKAGISIGGEFRSQYFTSKISGDSIETHDRAKEANEYTSVDFDIKARPNEAVSARVMFRMHQNWQNFFSDVSNPIVSRWISIDGNPLDMFRFNVGNFKEKYSPLTLWAPEIDIMYEPGIFARERQLAMDEMFIGENYRVLQGANFGFDAEIAPIFDEFHFGFSGARLMNSGTSETKVSNAYQKADMDKYYLGANLDLTFMRGIDFGGTLMWIFDNTNTYQGNLNKKAIDTIAQKTSVFSLRPGIDIGKTFDLPKSLKIDVSAEFAFSVDDTVAYDSVGIDSVGAAIKGYVYPEAIVGNAINLKGTIGISPSDAFGILLNGSFISNGKDFRNIMAQSPTFIGNRIMNREVVPGVDAVQYYSTFDALYHQVFKFTPLAGTNNWVKAPFQKTSYTNAVFMPDSFRAFKKLMDPSVQLVMPFGPATPNRVGINADVKLSLFNNGIELKGLLVALNEKDPDVIKIGEISLPMEKTEFSQFGGGAKFDISKMVEAIKYPMELSGSVVSSKASNSTPVYGGEITSNMINVGLNYQFWKRMSLLGGLQVIKNKAASDLLDVDPVTTIPTLTKFEVEQKMIQWSAGLEWKVSDGASVIGSFGKIIVDTDDKNPTPVGGNVINEWPEGYGAAPSGADFNQMIFNILLRVKF